MSDTMKRSRLGHVDQPGLLTPTTLVDATGLTLEERALLAALVTQPDFKKAADSIGMTHVHARKLFLASEPFRSAYNSLYGTARELVKRFNETLLPEAMHRLAELVQSANEDIALKAVRTVLQVAGQAVGEGLTPVPTIAFIVQLIQQQQKERGLPALDAEFTVVAPPPHPSTD